MKNGTTGAVRASPAAGAPLVAVAAYRTIRPAHLLASAALFMVILLETGRIPVETHTGTNEFGMEGRGNGIPVYTVAGDEATRVITGSPWAVQHESRADRVPLAPLRLRPGEAYK